MHQTLSDSYLILQNFTGNLKHTVNTETGLWGLMTAEWVKNSNRKCEQLYLNFINSLLLAFPITHLVKNRCRWTFSCLKRNQLLERTNVRVEFTWRAVLSSPLCQHVNLQWCAWNRTQMEWAKETGFGGKSLSIDFVSLALCEKTTRDPPDLLMGVENKEAQVWEIVLSLYHKSNRAAGWIFKKKHYRLRIMYPLFPS